MDQSNNRPQWAPEVVYAGRGGIGGTRCTFDCVSTITGDAIYKGTRSDGSVVHLLVPASNAHANQRRAFQMRRQVGRFVKVRDMSEETKTQAKARRREERKQRGARRMAKHRAEYEAVERKRRNITAEEARAIRGVS